MKKVKIFSYQSLVYGLVKLLDREIKNMRTRLVLATKSFSSFVIEVKFENFFES